VVEEKEIKKLKKLGVDFLCFYDLNKQNNHKTIDIVFAEMIEKYFVYNQSLQEEEEHNKKSAFKKIFSKKFKHKKIVDVIVDPVIDATIESFGFHLSHFTYVNSSRVVLTSDLNDKRNFVDLFKPKYDLKMEFPHNLIGIFEK
jgi:hypothetical protein